MAKCVRCNGSFLTRGKIKLKDALICFKCCDELGFDHKTMVLTGSLYSWDDIKDGADAYYINKKKAEIKEAALSSVSVKMTDSKRDLECTEAETEIYENICDMLDADDLQLVRKSDNYITIAVNDIDAIRFKCTNRAKWIHCLYGNEGKVPLGRPDDVIKLADLIAQSIESARKYSL